MPDFTVPDMSCDACARAITRAIGREDPAARVRVDLPAHRVAVESRHDPAAIAAAIADAGYTVAAAG